MIQRRVKSSGDWQNTRSFVVTCILRFISIYCFVISGLSICLELRSYRSSLWACAVKINHNTVLFLIELTLHDGKRWSSLCSSCCNSGLFESLYLQFVVIWKCFVYRSPKPQQIEMKLYCVALSKSAFDAVNISVATKSDRSLALVPLSRWRTRSGSHFTTLKGIFGIIYRKGKDLLVNWLICQSY